MSRDLKSVSLRVLSAAVVVGALWAPESAHAGLISPVVRGGANLFAPSIAGLYGSTGTSFIGGVGADVGLGPASVLVDVMYARRTFGASSLASQTINNLHVPVQGQLSLGFTHFSAGMYWAKILGDITTEALGNSVSTTPAAAGIKSTDLGVVVGAGIGVPLGLASLSFDVRVNWGLADVSTTAAISRKNRSIDLLVGLSF